MAGLPACLLNRLQSVLNAAARSIAGLRRSEHITDAVWPGFNDSESEHPSASSSNWRSLSTGLFTALHLSTCRTGCNMSLIYRRDVEAGCARRLPVFSTSASRGVSLSAIALLLLLAHDSGTVYLTMSSLSHLSQHFVRN